MDTKLDYSATYREDGDGAFSVIDEDGLLL